MRSTALFTALVVGSVLLVEAGLSIARAEPVRLTPKLLAHFDQPPTLVSHRGGVRVIGQDGRAWRLRLSASGDPSLVPAKTPLKLSDRHRPDIIPHGDVARGSQIAEAWFAFPTDEYAHGALGDIIEAKGLRARLSDGREISFRLPEGAVFEDLTPRIVDFDQDGIEDIIAVRSDEDGGGAVVVLRLRDQGFEIMAEAEPIGLANRWLNPIGVADLDGDGEMEIAYIEKPHLTGVLIILDRDPNSPGRLIGTRLGDGFSNHRGGVPRLRLHAVIDWDGDGTPEIAVPSFGYRDLNIIGFKDRKPVLKARVVFDRPIVAPVVLGDLDGDGRDDLVAALADGRLAILTR